MPAYRSGIAMLHSDSLFTGAPMREIVLQRFAEFKRNSEGGIPHLYVDTRDWVTVGIGCLLKSKEQARKQFAQTRAHWYVKGSAALPTEKMLDDDFDACVKLNKDLGGGVRSRAFEKVTSLRLTNAGIDEFTKLKMKAFEGTLFHSLTRQQWEEFPADAQFCCIAMMWGPGVWATLVKRYPALTTAIRNEDFAEAAKHITFKSNGNDTVRAFLNKAYRFMLSNASASMPKGCRGTGGVPSYFLNPALVYWPKKWEYDPESEIALETDVMPDHV